jgi:UDP-glucose 4-epimerase
MVSQFAIQYGINTCCLRAPWIMEKNDFRYSLSFDDDVFGGPVWNSLVAPEVAKRCQAKGTVPCSATPAAIRSSGIPSTSRIS